MFNKIEKTLHTMPSNYEIGNEYIIPEGIVRIEDYAFYSLEHSYIDCALPSTLVSIGNCAFANNSFSSGSVLFNTFPFSLKELGEGAFYKTSFGLTDSTLFEGTQIKTIPDLCFAGAEISLHDYYAPRNNPLSEGIMHIGNYAFADTGLYIYGNEPFDFTIPASVETVPLH